MRSVYFEGGKKIQLQDKSKYTVDGMLSGMTVAYFLYQTAIELSVCICSDRRNIFNKGYTNSKTSALQEHMTMSSKTTQANLFEISSSIWGWGSVLVCFLCVCLLLFWGVV